MPRTARPLYAFSWIYGLLVPASPVTKDEPGKPNFKDDIKAREKEYKNSTVEPEDSYSRDAQQPNVSLPVRVEGFKTDAIQRCQKKVEQLMLEHGIPGLVVGVSIKQQRAWSGAFGYCDVENTLLCKNDSIMRIASISKSLTMSTAVAKLMEENKLNLSSSIHEYLTESEFPKQKIKETTYDINLKQLLSNTSGIRHYHKDEEAKKLPVGSPKSIKAYMSESEMERTGHYQRKTYRNVIDSLEIFKHDDLVCEPGTKFSYSTYGWVLVSAIVQKVLNKNDRFEDYLMKLMRDLGMRNTRLDLEEPIIFNRSRYYTRNGVSGRLLNAPSVDLSCKWAGGGLLSHTDDLLRLANVLIHSYKGRENSFLKSDTVRSMWTPVVGTGPSYESYGLGFFIGSDDLPQESTLVSSYFEPRPKVAPFKFYVYHTGSAVGASSILAILPEEEIAVAIIVNLSDVNLYNLAFAILKEFAQ